MNPNTSFYLQDKANTGISMLESVFPAHLTLLSDNFSHLTNRVAGAVIRPDFHTTRHACGAPRRFSAPPPTRDSAPHGPQGAPP